MDGRLRTPSDLEGDVPVAADLGELLAFLVRRAAIARDQGRNLGANHSCSTISRLVIHIGVRRC
jgi:hypothetical protein